MVAVNNLGLEGLRTILNIKSNTTYQRAGAPEMEDILAAKSDSVIVSALAKDVGEIYQRIKETGSDEAIAGFSSIVQAFGTDLTGQAIVDVVRGADAMSGEDLQNYGQLVGTIDELGSPASLARFARQSAQAFTVDAELGRSYLGATAAIVNADYSGNPGKVVDQQLTNLNDFMSKFAKLANSEEPTGSDIDVYKQFAEGIRARTTGEEIAQDINDFSPGDESPAG